jgi:hypothetical protein
MEVKLISLIVSACCCSKDFTSAVVGKKEVGSQQLQLLQK